MSGHEKNCNRPIAQAFIIIELIEKANHNNNLFNDAIAALFFCSQIQLVGCYTLEYVICFKQCQYVLVSTSSSSSSLREKFSIHLRLKQLQNPHYYLPSFQTHQRNHNSSTVSSSVFTPAAAASASTLSF